VSVAALLASGFAGQTSPCVSSSGSQMSALCTAADSIHVPLAYRSILPLLVVTVGALALLALSAVLPKRSLPGLYPGLSALIGLGAVGTGVWEWYDVGHRGAQVTMAGAVFYDRYSVFFSILIGGAVVVSSMFSDSYLRREGLDGVESYVLVLLAASGAMLMASAGDLIVLFLGLEVMSISLYVMASFHRRRSASGEAGFKYFIVGAFSSAILLYGVALIYGATGSTRFGEIAAFLSQNGLAHGGVLLAGMALVIVGLGFKVSAVPFHYWTPDVYQGSPTPFTGFMAAVAKAAGFAGLIRVLAEALSSEQVNWRPALWLIAVLTLAVGSVLAIAQRDLKRMMAYSSISQAGYVLVGLQAASAQGYAGALFYLLTYLFIIMGTFAVIGLVQGSGEARNDLGAMRGLARRQPILALTMLVFLLAQAGIPLTSGFLAKFYVISASIQRGQYALAVIAMLAAAVAAFFYLRVALIMYMEPRGPEGLDGAPDPVLVAGLSPVSSLDGPLTATAVIEAPASTTITVRAADALGLALCTVVTIGAGVSAPLIDFARHATMLF
jgi:NADH-quinone oxidoreductase subunit N